MSLNIHVFSVTYELVIHYWIRGIEGGEIAAFDLDNDHTWELRCSSKPEQFTTEVTMRGDDRPANHMVEAEVRRLSEPSWLSTMHQKNGYQYSVDFTEVRYKTVGDLIEGEPSWYDLTDHYREPIENILPKGRKTIGDITARYRRKPSDILPDLSKEN